MYFAEQPSSTGRGVLEPYNNSPHMASRAAQARLHSKETHHISKQLDPYLGVGLVDASQCILRVTIKYTTATREREKQYQQRQGSQLGYLASFIGRRRL